MGWEVIVLGKLKDMKCAVMESRDENSAVKLQKLHGQEGRMGIWKSCNGKNKPQWQNEADSRRSTEIQDGHLRM